MHPEATSSRKNNEFWSEIKKDLAADLEWAGMEGDMANGGGQGSQEEVGRPDGGRERGDGALLHGNAEGLQLGGDLRPVKGGHNEKD